MNTIQIRSILSSDVLCQSVGIHVGAREQFWKQICNFPTGCFVFNTHYSHQPGEHWLAVYANDSEVDFFDSFGRSVSFYPDVNEILSIHGGYETIRSNETQLQNFLSTVCGDYCVYFCLLRSRGWSMDEIVRSLRDIGDSEMRDHSIRRFIIQTYPNFEFIEDNTVEGIDGVHIQGTNLLSKLLK